jgi:hypothetical protein
MRGTGTATSYRAVLAALANTPGPVSIAVHLPQAVAFPELTENGQPRGTAGANVLTLDAIKANSTRSSCGRNIPRRTNAIDVPALWS